MEGIQRLGLSKNRWIEICTVLGINIILILSAWISIRLPFYPVPFSLTSTLVLFFSLSLGKRGAYATLLYFLEGALGCPVFANGGGGWVYLMGPTGGYLIGYVAASTLLAILKEKGLSTTSLRVFTFLLLGNFLLYVFGIPHLAQLIGLEKAIQFGLLPFIGTDLFKLLVAYRGLSLMRKLKSN